MLGEGGKFTGNLWSKAMKPIRTGVIGAGRMGQHHCRVYAGIRHTKLIGVFDTNRDAGEDLARKYETKYYKSLNALLENVDAVSIATPTSTHYELVMRCLERGIHVLVEKPLADSIEEAEDLAWYTQQSGLVVEVGHIERFNPTYQELKNVLFQFEPYAISFRRLTPYAGSNIDIDVVLDLMVLDLDLALDLTAREPDRFSSFGLTPLSGNLDHVVAQLYYKNGLIISLTASRLTEHNIRSVEITTRKAYLEADFLNKGIVVHHRSLDKDANLSHLNAKYHQERILERILVPNVEPLFQEIQHFLQCIRDQATPAVSVVDGLRALRLALQIRDLVALCQSTRLPVPIVAS
jgi:predicted dehydrogenase